MKGIAGYGRYDDDPDYIGCPFAKSDMTPCVARDGHITLVGDPPEICVGCGHTPRYLISDLAAEYEPARHVRDVTSPEALADRFAELVRTATEPEEVR